MKKLQIKEYSLTKLIVFRILSVLVNILPLIVLLIINWNVYTKTRSESVALTVTGIVWLIYLIMSAFSTFSPKFSRPVKLLVAFIVLELIDPLVGNLKWFALCGFIGALADYLVIQPIIKNLLELKVATKTSEMTRDAIKDILKEEKESEESDKGRV